MNMALSNIRTLISTCSVLVGDDLAIHLTEIDKALKNGQELVKNSNKERKVLVNTINDDGQLSQKSLQLLLPKESERELNELHNSLIRCSYKYTELHDELFSCSDELTQMMNTLSRYRIEAYHAWKDLFAESEKCRLAILFFKFHWWHQSVSQHKDKLRISRRRKKYYDALTDASNCSGIRMKRSRNGSTITSGYLIKRRRVDRRRGKRLKRKAGKRSDGSWEGEDWSPLNIENACKDVANHWYEWEKHLFNIEQSDGFNEGDFIGYDDDNNRLLKNTLKEVRGNATIKDLTCDWKWVLYMDSSPASDKLTLKESMDATSQIYWIKQWLISQLSKGMVVPSSSSSLFSTSSFSSAAVSAAAADSDGSGSGNGSTDKRMLSFYRVNVSSNATSVHSSSYSLGSSSPELLNNAEELPDYMDDDDDDDDPVVRICCQAFFDRSVRHSSCSSSSTTTKMELDENDDDKISSKGAHGIFIFRVLAHGQYFSSSMTHILESIPVGGGVPLIILSLDTNGVSNSGPNGHVACIEHSLSDRLSKMPPSLKNVLPSHVFGKGRFSSIIELRLNVTFNDFPSRSIVKFCSSNVKKKLFSCFTHCSKYHPKYQTDVKTWLMNYPIHFRPVTILWNWMLSSHGLSVLKRYNLALATMIEIFTVESANSSNYYEIGHEFENSFGKEADHHQYQHYDRLCSLEHCQSILRNLMLQENYALKNMNDTVVQECLNKNDHSGAMNYLLHLQFNKLSNRIPYMAGSSNQLNKGRNMIHNLISVLISKENEKNIIKEEEEEERKNERVKKRLKSNNQEDENTSLNGFEKILQEEDEFEQMLRDSLQ